MQNNTKWYEKNYLQFYVKRVVSYWVKEEIIIKSCRNLIKMQEKLPEKIGIAHDSAQHIALLGNTLIMTIG